MNSTWNCCSLAHWHLDKKDAVSALGKTLKPEAARGRKELWEEWKQTVAVEMEPTGTETMYVLGNKKST